MPKNNDCLYETNTYFVRVGGSLDFDGPTANRLLYQVVNRNTEVVEREDFALPFAIRMAKDLERELEAAYKVEDDEEELPGEVAH